MKYLFQNYAGFQNKTQLIVSPPFENSALTIEIKQDNDPENSNQYQLTIDELVELRDLTSRIIDELAAPTTSLKIQ